MAYDKSTNFKDKRGFMKSGIDRQIDDGKELVGAGRKFLVSYNVRFWLFILMVTVVLFSFFAVFHPEKWQEMEFILLLVPLIVGFYSWRFALVVSEKALMIERRNSGLASTIAYALLVGVFVAVLFMVPSLVNITFFSVMLVLMIYVATNRFLASVK